ncbi:hypothetical protein HaLaN_21674 [Haematococcus lacustris]|uniref:Uncharacterized protein n=1 Tax=Haematococcus lacustris TaxID=44745 RepID=A0A699ZZN1_HAELA|nr:hypothetical protein HaLaN_21674 [Haematococcus lacustris]
MAGGGRMFAKTSSVFANRKSVFSSTRSQQPTCQVSDLNSQVCRASQPLFSTSAPSGTTHHLSDISPTMHFYEFSFKPQSYNHVIWLCAKSQAAILKNAVTNLPEYRRASAINKSRSHSGAFSWSCTMKFQDYPSPGAMPWSTPRLLASSLVFTSATGW